MARRDAGEVAFHQGDAGAGHGDLGAGAHGDADIGGGEGRGVVDAVARHGDDVALGLQALRRRACRREDLGDHLGDAELAGDGFGRGAVVAGQHHEAEA